MIYSMTGFGQGDAVTATTRIAVQLRAVNHRFADIRLRLPYGLLAREREIRAWIGEGVQRGRIEAQVHLEPAPGLADAAINRALVEEVIRTARILRDEYEIPGELDVTQLISLPGLMRTDSTELTWGDEEEAALRKAVDEAVSQLRADRAREGESLRLDLVRRAEAMQRQARELSRLSAEIPSRLKERVTERLDSLRGEVELDPVRVAQEAVFLADRSDVTEEMVRLEGHLQQLFELLDDPDGKTVGKRLEFLVQEIHRETNTVNSKSADLETSRCALELKQETEKVREQIANLE